MELLINPTSWDNANKLIELGVQQICVGLKDFSTRNSCIISLEQITKLVNNKKNTKILVLYNKIFFDEEIEDLEKSLIEITKLNIDGIIFADYAVNQILFEHNINIYQIYHPETLVTNYGQIPFFKENGINEIVLSRELNSNDIHEIIINKQSMKIQLQVSGYAYMMWSRWNLLSNFKQSQNIKDDLINKKLFLKEPKREQKFIIIEDKDGTHMLTNYNLSLLQKLNELSEWGVDTIRIDSFLHDENWLLNEVEIYMQTVNILNNSKKLSEEFVSSSIEKMQKYNTILSKGFYSLDKNDLIYLSKDESDK